MALDLEINIEDIRKVINLILDHIENDLKISKVRIEEDYYWNMDKNHIYNVLEEPKESSIGQLYHDWEFLLHINSKDDAVSLMLIHVAPLLRYIGEKIGQ
jgi:hypothetical protein